jgi:hypothetical protein
VSGSRFWRASESSLTFLEVFRVKYKELWVEILKNL